ncbi:MAG: hypothetical protein IKU09_07100 [Firmicutes bacterium]|nr:hypothetical protein [Bacillota bacterium]
MKRLLSILLCIVLVATMMPVTALANDSSQQGKLYWHEKTDDFTLTVTQIREDSSACTVSLNGKQLTAQDLTGENGWYDSMTTNAGWTGEYYIVHLHGSEVVTFNNGFIVSTDENKISVSNDNGVHSLEFKTVGSCTIQTNDGKYKMVVNVEQGSGPSGGEIQPVFAIHAKGTMNIVDENGTLDSRFFNRDLELLVNGEVQKDPEPLQLSGGGTGDASFEGPNDGIFRIKPTAGGQKILRVTWHDITREFLLEISEDDAQSGGQGSGPSGGDSSTGQLYFIYDNDYITLDGNRIKINGEVVENRDNVSAAIDQYGIASIEGGMGGHFGYFAIKENGTLIALEGVESENQYVAEIRERDNRVKEICVKNPGTAVLSIEGGDGRMYEMTVTAAVSGLNIRGGGWTATPGNIGNGIFMSIMTVYDGNGVITNYTVKSTDTEVGDVEITPDGKIEFMPHAVGTTKMIITYDNQTYEYDIEVEAQDLGGGQGGEGGGNQGQIHLMDSNNQPFQLNTIYTNELGTGKKFYFALETDGNSMPQDLKYELEDKYMSMARGGYHREDGIMDITSGDAGIKVMPIDPVQNAALYANLGLNNLTSAYRLYEAVVSNDNLVENTYLQAGIINGWIRFYDDNDDILCETEFSVFTDNFLSWMPVTDNNVIHFLEEGDESPVIIAEKTLKMYKPLSDDANAIYVQAPGAEEPVVEAYLAYEERKQNGTAMGYRFLGEMNLEASGYNDDIYKINVPAFYGHNDIVLLASTSDQKVTKMTVKKAVQYKYTAGGLDLAEIQSDYLPQLAYKSGLMDNLGEGLLDDPVTADGCTTREFSEIGRNRTSNRPYNGGFFGMTMDIADGYELEGIKVTGFDTNDHATESYLWYLMMQNSYFTAFNPDGPIDENLYQNGTGMQTPYLRGNYGMIEASANTAEYFYNEETDEYRVVTYAENPQAVATAMGNMKTYAEANKISVSYIETSTYYDIGIMHDFDTIEDFYEALDKIGTIEFVLKEASAENAVFDQNADAEDAAGIKPSDNASQSAWGEGHMFEDFVWIKKNNECYGDHNEAIQNFYGEGSKVVVGAYEFEMQENETFKGMVDIYIPVPKGVDHKECTIYWMYDGVPVPLPCRYVDGYLVFTTSHFSEYVIAADEDAIGDEYAEDTTGSSGGGAAGDSGEGGEGGAGNEGGNPGGSTGGNTGGSIGGGFVPVKPADPLATAKKEASTEVNTYVDADDYADAEAAEIQAILDQAKKNIEAAKSADEIKAIEESAKAEIDKLETAEEKALIAEVEEIKFKARSRMTTLKGKKAIKVYWNTPDGMEFDGFDVFRSAKKNSGYGKKPFYTAKLNYYINNKDLKAGKTYYYKIRGFKYVNDEKVYTEYSYKAWRTVK